MTIAHAQLHLALLVFAVVDVCLALCVVLREEHALRLPVLRAQSPLLASSVVRLRIVR